MLGIPIATAASYVLSGVTALPYAFTLSIKLLALVFAAAFGVVASYSRARSAARKDPIKAL